jgi:hypothetical protein
VVSEDQTMVTDTITGLLWQRDGSSTRDGCSGSGNLTCTWAEAQAYCTGLRLGGFSDWRVPAVMELRTLLNFTGGSPTIDPIAFPGAPPAWFWTSSPSAGSSGKAWYVNFSDGSSYYYLVSDNNYYVRCVR